MLIVTLIIGSLVILGHFWKTNNLEGFLFTIMIVATTIFLIHKHESKKE